MAMPSEEEARIEISRSGFLFSRWQKKYQLAWRSAHAGDVERRRVWHGINELEHGTLIGGRELPDALEPLEQPCGAR